jgi:hypothetical protein
VYSSALTVLSEEIILLVRLREPALELCRLSNIDDSEKASLEMVRILSLPVLTASTSLWWAACFDEHPGHALFSKNRQQHPSLHGLHPHPHLSSSSGLSTQQPEGRIDTRRHLHSVPADGIIVVQMHLNQLSGISRTFDLTVRRRTLLEFSNAQAQAGAAGTGTGTGAVLAVPWEKWGPNKAHILEHDSDMCGGSRASQYGIIIRSVCSERSSCSVGLRRRSRLSAGVWSRLSRRSRCIVVVSVSAAISRRACRMSRRSCHTIGATIF